MDTTGSDTLKEFFTGYKLRHYKYRDFVIRPGKLPPGVCYIEKGFVKISTDLESGRELIVNIFKPGAYFSVMWAVGDISNSYYFKALSDLEVRIAPKAAFIEYLHHHPDELMALTKRLTSGMAGLVSNIESFFSGNSYNRVIRILHLCSKRFGATNGEGEMVIEVPLTHQDIADMAGIARETTSLILKKLVSSNLITRKNRRYTILDPEKLEAEAEMEEPEKNNLDVI